MTNGHLLACKSQKLENLLGYLGRFSFGSDAAFSGIIKVVAKESRVFTAKNYVVLSALVLAAWGLLSVVTLATPTKSATPKPSTARQVPPYEFPAGGRTLFPNYRLVALYGTPDVPVLGALGAQNLPRSIARAKALAKTYQPYTKEHVLPTMEIITTVASASPTENEDYSQEVDIATLRPWVKAAQKAGVYVVLDLQPGRAEFLSQAKRYTELLRYPNVGLALDPEWRLKPDQVPLVQIGSVDIHEVNATAGWLADLTEREQLPQKVFLLHEFRLTMLPHRDQLDTTHKQLAYAIQMDGQGAQSEKAATWSAIKAQPPTNVHFGWKNFYHKDAPILTPAQTMQLKPMPWYISYQ